MLIANPIRFNNIRNSVIMSLILTSVDIFFFSICMARGTLETCLYGSD